MSLMTRYYVNRKPIMTKRRLYPLEGFVIKDRHNDAEIIFPDCWHYKPTSAKEWVDHPAMRALYEMNEHHWLAYGVKKVGDTLYY